MAIFKLKNVLTINKLELCQPRKKNAYMDAEQTKGILEWKVCYLQLSGLIRTVKYWSNMHEKYWRVEV